MIYRRLALRLEQHRQGKCCCPCAVGSCRRHHYVAVQDIKQEGCRREALSKQASNARLRQLTNDLIGSPQRPACCGNCQAATCFE